MSVERLTPLDASFLEIEEADECSHMHVGWAMVFDPPPGGGAPDPRAVRRRIGERLSAMPRFACRLSSPRTARLSWPTWEDDPFFDLGAHVRHATLPHPGGEAELLDWMGDFFSHRLDRTRPLWETALLDGLADGQWALVAKIHHALIDGVSGAAVTALLLDLSPAGEPALSEPPPLPPAGNGPAGVPGLMLGGARAGLDAVLHPRRVLERSRALAGLLVEDAAATDTTSVNVPIGATRRMDVVDVELSELKVIKRALGGTVNDAALAIAAGGMRELFTARGEPAPHRFRVMVPVSVRHTSESIALGNRVSSLFVELPVDEPDPLARYHRTVAAAERLKSSGQASGAEALMDLAGLAPPALHAFAARMSFTPRLFNMTITNVPGSPVTLYAHGAPMRRIIPLVPIFAHHAVGLAVVSYAGNVAFGLNADRAAVQDLHVLSEGIARSYHELRDLARDRADGPVATTA